MIFMIRDSLLDNQELLYDILKTRYKVESMPSNLDEINESTLSIIKYADRMYQNNIMPLEMTLDLITSLIQGDFVRKNNINNSEIYLGKLQELYSLLESKYRTLIYEYNIGDLPKNKFIDDFINLKSLSINTLAEIEEDEAILSHY